jgi:murein DD-endopeptidase MepM/ murein hydrolase activator NlpD
MVPGAGNPQAFNRYSYVLNRPLNHIDPTGHTYICATGCDDPDEGRNNNRLNYKELGKANQWSTPVFKRRISGYQHGEKTFYSSAHKGTDYGPNFDINGAKTEIVRASGPGIVIRSKSCAPCTRNSNIGYGNVVDIAHSYDNLPDNVVSEYGMKSGDFLLLRYAHLKDRSGLRAGDKVNSGSVVGLMGTTGNSTGVHLHLEPQVVSGSATDVLTVRPGDKGDWQSSSKWSIGIAKDPEKVTYFSDTTETSYQLRGYHVQ